MKKIPLYPFLIGLFPVLSLGAMNIREIDVRVMLRPTIVSLAIVVVLFALSALLLRNIYRAAVLTSFLAIGLFSYGHLYHALREIPSIGLQIARHRYLLLPYLMFLTAGSWFIIRRLRNAQRLTAALNIVGVILVAFPVFQIVRYSLNNAASEEVSAELFGEYEPLKVADLREAPDIYYIILDTYTRADALENEFDFDNSPFLDELEALGFYVADCSRSNYPETYGSLSSALNMNYLSELKKDLMERGFSEADFDQLIKHSLVRELLEDAGYTIVAFDTGYEWSRIPDADVYLGVAFDPLSLQVVEPFEAMFVKNTIGLVWADYLYIAQTDEPEAPDFASVNFPYKGYAGRQLLILNELPELERVPGPKFVFAHILIPHVPRVFAPDGSILADPGYYSGELAGAANAEYDREGYLSEIQFINNRILAIVKEIIADAERPVYIIIQGDTGKGGSNKFQILNAYYFDGDRPEDLYSSITPINTFRLIFNQAFNAGFDYLPDKSMLSEGVVEPEASQRCIQRAE